VGIGELVRKTSLQVIRRCSDRYIWTHPSVLATFRCRPSFLGAFKETGLLLMWGNLVRRRLREAIAVAISTANHCIY
jgi:hypothetical protein